MNYLMAIVGALSLANGAFMLMPKWRYDAQRRRAKRIAAIEAGGPERYFEELRALKAYPLPAAGRRWTLRAIFVIVLGLGSILFAFVEKPH